ncbi:MAG: GNAT family N-acetyltransferase [Bacteroidota bacterium]
MGNQEQVDIELRRWTENDLRLLEHLMGDAAMTQHIGGPETPDKIRKRLERYCMDSNISKVHMFVIVLESSQTGIGSIGYWERKWLGQAVWESGWRILLEYQGRGIATQAIGLIVERARAEQKHRFMHAFPSIDNGSSNTLCRKMGFILQGEVDFEYPPGRWMRSNDWRLDLFGDPAPIP